MTPSQWPREFLERQEVYIDSNHHVVVVDSRGYHQNIWQDAGIVDAQWVANAVIVTFRDGRRFRVFSPSQNAEAY